MTFISRLSFSMIASLALAVAASAAETQWGLRAGMGVSGFNFHNESHLGIGFSGSAGFVSSIPVSCEKFPILNSLSVAPEFLYTLYSARMSMDEGSGYYAETEDLDVFLQAVEMPVLLHYSLPLKFPVFVELGPQVGFAVISTTNHKIQSATWPEDDLDESGDTEDLNRFMVGGTAGVGYKVDEHLLIDLRYHFEALEYADGTNGRPFSIQFGADYLF